jgi:hypothetical protein
MKTITRYLAGLLLVSGLLGFYVNSNAQDPKPDKKAKKEAKRAESEANFRVLDSLLYMGQYVLEANFLQNKYGDRVSVSSNLNFIRVEGPKGVLQTGSDMRFGSNGVGGVTAEGTIGNYKISRNLKNLSCTVTFDIVTNIGSFNIYMVVSSDNNARATISGTTSGKLTWDGHLATLSNSRVFKGSNTI